MFLYCTVMNDLTSCFLSWVVFSCRYFTLFTQFLINCHDIWQSEWRKWRKLKITWLLKWCWVHCIMWKDHSIQCVVYSRSSDVHKVDSTRHIQSYCGQCFTCGASDHHRVLMWFMSQHTVSSSVCETGSQWSSHIHGSLEKSFEREKHLTVKDKDVFVLHERPSFYFSMSYDSIHICLSGHPQRARIIFCILLCSLLNMDY